MKGDIRNGPYATRAKEYVWSTVADCLPRGITPSDADAEVEINWCFFVFEGKTEGKKLDKGQRQYLHRKMLSFPEGKAIAVVAEHTDLDRVDVATQIKQMAFCWRRGRDLQWSNWIDGHIAPLLSLFARDAETGSLHPDTWEAEILHMARPFTGDAA